LGNVDGDGSIEIVTGGWLLDGTRWGCQLCVLGTVVTLALKTSKRGIGQATHSSVSCSWQRGWGWGVGDRDRRLLNDDSRYVAQLCVWNRRNAGAGEREDLVLEGHTESNRLRVETLMVTLRWRS